MQAKTTDLNLFLSKQSIFFSAFYLISGKTRSGSSSLNVFQIPKMCSFVQVFIMQIFIYRSMIKKVLMMSHQIDTKNVRRIFFSLSFLKFSHFDPDPKIRTFCPDLKHCQKPGPNLTWAADFTQVSSSPAGVTEL